MKILIVAAHPDDETLGAGATIAKHAENGDRVHVLILGEGITSRKKQTKTAELYLLRKHCRRALNILGVKNVYFLNLPDNMFDNIPLLSIVKEVENKINKIKPDIIYTHYESDLNVDHQLTFRAVMTACRPVNNKIKKILCFEVPSSTEWSALNKNSFTPNCFVNVESTLGKKLAALKEYKKEMRSFPHPRSIEYVKSLAKIRGSNVAYKAAEAFIIVREKVNK